MAATSLIPVEFHGVSLLTISIDGVPHVALRPICEAIGIQWEGQLQRIKRHPVLSATMCVTHTVAQDGKSREVVCLPLDKLNGWLFGVTASRTRPEIRERLIQYQRECFDVLARHFMPESAGTPALPAPELPPIDVRTLLLSGQSEPVTLTAEAQALVDAQAWRMAGEAYLLSREHIARAIAYRTNANDREQRNTPHLASIVNNITLNQALAHAYWSELRSLRRTAETAIYIAQQSFEHINAVLAGEPMPKDMLF